MNFLVTHVTKYPPIKLSLRKFYRDSVYQDGHDPAAVAVSNDDISLWLSSKHFRQRQFCLNRFVEEFGYMALQRSAMRFDPLLFKDHVSIVRKKYRFIDVAS